MEYINCESYKSLCDEIYDGPTRKPPNKNCVVYVPMDNIPEFFLNIVGRPHKYVVVSGKSDYGVVYQEENTVANDMRYWLHFIGIEPKNYDSVFLPARCQTEYCKITDRYSVKMHFYTKATFNEIPENIVHWFSTNANINNNRVTQIPFGIPEWTQKLLSDKPTAFPREDKVYVNFQLNNNLRAFLKVQLRHEEWCSVIESEVSQEDYVHGLLTHKYVLSPPGNGFDCYRNLEAIYAGAIPIIENKIWAKGYSNLPVIFSENLALLNKDTFDYIRTMAFPPISLDGSKADLNYWKKAIDSFKGAL